MPSKGQPINSNFTAGELSPLMKGRFDVEQYQNGLETLENWIILPQGGIRRRDGSEYVSNAIADAKQSRLIPVVFTRTEAYILELSDIAYQIYRFDSSGDPEKITGASGVTVLLEAELDEVDYAVIDDSVYLAHGSHAPIKIQKQAFDTWVLTNFDDAGQLLNPASEITPLITSHTQNAAKTPYIGAFDANSRLIYDGSRLITAVGDFPPSPQDPQSPFVTVAESELFSTTDHASAINITSIPFGGATFQFRASDVGAIFKLQGLTDTKGYYIITSFVTATNVKAELRTLSISNPLSDENYHIVQWVAWHGGRSGYPSTVTEFEGRLVFGGVESVDIRPRKELTVWGSKPEDFTNFDNGSIFTLSASSSYQFTLASRNGSGKIRWLRGARVLLIGGDLTEYRVASGISALSVDAKVQTFYGSSGPHAIEVGYSVLFVQRNESGVRRLEFLDRIDNYFAVDLTVLSEHITKSSIVSPTFQLNPNSILWFVRDDGELIGMTFFQELGLIGWHRHTTGAAGEYESVASIPSFDGTEDRIWVAVKRTIDGSTERHIEVLDPSLNTDDAKKFTSIVGGGLTGLDHLEGETVEVVADGIYRGTFTVASGAIDIGRDVTVAEVGLHYDAEAKLMPFPTRPLSKKRSAEIQLRVDNIQAGITVNDEQITTFQGGSPMDSAPPVFTGLTKTHNLGWDDENQIVIKSTLPFDATILAIAGQLEIGD